MNMVVSDSVGGSITLILKDVPWDQALDIILQQKGLDMRKNGNVIMIAPGNCDQGETGVRVKKFRLVIAGTAENESFQMNYIKAADVQKLLVDPKQTLLSKRGSACLTTGPT